MEPLPLLCNTEDTLTTALPHLQGCNTLILDCEGLRLGERGGSLSLVTLRTTEPSPVRTYIIDFVRLPRAALQPVFDVLRCSTVRKVLFDGRMDYSALYHEHGVELANVLDVQLVDVASRRTRGEGQPAQFRRLQRYLPYTDPYSNIEAYQQVHKLSGLNECVEEHNVTTLTAASKGSGTFPGFQSLCILLIIASLLVDHTRWLLRPLPQSYLSYASADVALIHALYDKFMRLHYISLLFSSQSALYISMWKHHQPTSSESHLRHPLLPLGVLSAPNTSSRAMSCTLCGRELSETAFPARSRNVVAERRCWVCRAVAAKNNNIRQWESDFGAFDPIEEEDNWGGEDYWDDYPLSARDIAFWDYE